MLGEKIERVSEKGDEGERKGKMERERQGIRE